ncbi:Putative ribosomal N-acetyltransferase YdaF [Campylobacter sputorum subsp. bubulus]|uniref:Ribosomal N-acetyltransferase YdaF n=1 Tax=Campylobacter sputorum subsp. sputorum TaxID=32024 RepID=A0A381DJK3_9BACT|nr:GNAT family protein [Campylobacter sputorum]ASM35745.1 acetyltransferase [Campylobacter sputorum aubsp. sputorum RM3237]KAB0581448.1 GNAT family N-acetyltransferase [Campylobacter sputorum subsp. sputorum]QEL05935.1 acetyltransferase [Campylobacter sputorum subsp. sputorum]SUX09028.1 Putative ribosomal N-acetyltransferase YdaF [Campylobacter sputorum subsp. bubulus]SUX10717.1 Putative ribosomal N-acetyltransferase YdaF [Campylobacter sputorum subsp. sputorum]
MILEYDNVTLISYDEEINNISLRDKYYSWLMDSDVNIFFGSHNLNSYESKEALMNASFERFTKKECQGFFVKNSDEFVGTVRVSVDFKNRYSDIGIMIGEKNLWGQGIGTKAFKIATRYAFENLKLHCVSAATLEINARMKRVFEKLGFKHDGLLRDVVIINDNFVSNNKYSILENEYEALKNIWFG